MSNGQPFHLAALLWRRGSLIRIGINGSRARTWATRYFNQHSVSPQCSIVHAEMDAIIDARHGDELHVIRWNVKGEPCMAKPCRHCQRLIDKLQLKVWFTNHNGEWERL